jgi:hypothetical protein
MDRGRASSGCDQGGDREGKKRRRPAGLEIIERDGHWHVHGTLHIKGRRIRIRRSTHIPAVQARYEDAQEERRRLEEDVRSEFDDKPRPGPHLSIAAKAYLNQKRSRPLGVTAVGIIKEIASKFGLRRVGDILDSEWSAFVDARHAGNSSETRERYLNTLLAFLAWCAKNPRRWGVVPTLDRDKAARNPRRRKIRTVTDLSPRLIAFVLEHAAPHLKAQLWTEWSTGARVSSILHGCRLCDVILAEGREHIAFHATKNGETVTAALHPRAAEAIRDYLKVRGRLHDREGPLFLTQRRKPYSENTEGTQNKTAFNAMKRRARKALRQQAFERARAMIGRGEREAAAEIVASARAAHRLIGRVTQHWFRHILATRFRGDVKGATLHLPEQVHLVAVGGQGIGLGLRLAHLLLGH